MTFIDAIEEELSRDYRVKAEIQLDEAYVTGAGDSYAAAITIEGKTKGRFKAIDPYEALDFEVIKKPLVIVSVSGKPKSNIMLARKFRGKVRIIVITANKFSPLATYADEIVELPYKPKTILPGTLSFLMSLSALFSLANIDEDRGEGEEIFLRNPFFVGKGENYGIAYFASLKMAEIFGLRTSYERLEQFCHSPIFASKDSEIIILSSGDKRESELKSLINYTQTYITECGGAFCNAKTVLKSIVYTMKKIKWDRVYFLEDKNILSISSTMIY